MKTIIFHNPRCSKCRYALDQLEEAGCDIQVVEYLKDTPNLTELKELVDMLGIKPHDLIRTKEPLYKEKFEGKKLTDRQWLKAMHDNPILIERPILIRGDMAVIGRSDEAIDKITSA